MAFRSTSRHSRKSHDAENSVDRGEAPDPLSSYLPDRARKTSESPIWTLSQDVASVHYAFLSLLKGFRTFLVAPFEHTSQKWNFACCKSCDQNV